MFLINIAMLFGGSSWMQFLFHYFSRCTKLHQYDMYEINLESQTLNLDTFNNPAYKAAMMTVLPSSNVRVHSLVDLGPFPTAVKAVIKAQ